MGEPADPLTAIEERGYVVVHDRGSNREAYEEGEWLAAARPEAVLPVDEDGEPQRT